MNGPQQSAYGVADTANNNIHREERVPERIDPPPPKAAPRTTVPSRPVTVATLREAKASTAAAQRVPITQRVKEPEVPARLKQKKKTVAFGVTTNVSQTVEREKDPYQPPLPPLRAITKLPPHPLPPSSSTPSPMSAPPRAGVGLAKTATARHASSATREAALRNSPAVMRADENRPPMEEVDRQREEMKDSSTILRLESRVAELEKRERAHKASHSELLQQFDNVVKIVSKLTERIAVLEVDKSKSSTESVVLRSEDEETLAVSLSETRHRRQLYPEEEEEEEGRRGERGRRRETDERRDGRKNGLLGDQDALRALQRQLSSNPVLRRHILDAIDQDKYEHEYGDRRRTHSPLQRRGGGGGAGLFDEFDDGPRAAPVGRSSAPTQRWKEQRQRVSPPAGTGGRGGGGGVTRKRSDVTPSRRRVTERVTMERVHHFDDDTDEGEEDREGDFYERYDSDPNYPQTLYSEEVVEDFNSTAHHNGHGYGNRNQQQYAPRGPMITELNQSGSEEDELERRRRQLRERKEARGRK